MKPRRILHVGNFNFFRYGASFYATDWKIQNGLVRNGHMVLPFSYREVVRWENFLRTSRLGQGRMNRRLVENVEIFRPELILFGHSETIEPETISFLRKRFPQTRFAMWYVDSIVFPEKRNQLKIRAERMDWVFVTTGGEHLKELKSEGNRVAFFPNIADSSIERSRNFEKGREDLELDFLYCGRDYSKARTSRIKSIVESLPDLRREVWGTLGNPALTGQAYYDKLAEAAMSLNLSHREDIPMYTSGRMTQLTGCGILTFCPKTPGIDLLFREDEVVYYDQDKDLIEKIKYYATHDEERMNTARKGWERVHVSFNPERVTRYMLESVFGEFHGDRYEWGDSVV